MVTKRFDAGTDVTYACSSAVLNRLGADALAEAEHAHAAGIKHIVRREHFIAGRSLLRHSLSVATGHAVQPGEWQFAIGVNGKPSVVPGQPQVQFNISHAEGLVAVVTNPAAQVGIDVELVTGTRGAGPVLDLLTRREQAWLDRQCVSDRWHAFLQLWTAKEATSKAVGLGCAVDFRELEIDVPAGQVRGPDGMVGTGSDMGIVMAIIEMQGAVYCLCVATVHSSGQETLNQSNHSGHPGLECHPSSVPMSSSWDTLRHPRSFC